ncbi:MAG: hypothetical protein MJD61_10085, partial [Proteobacteria bacterium]|nr:hypothetical protein [Pseudomonadota bacterium]
MSSMNRLRTLLLIVFCGLQACGRTTTEGGGSDAGDAGTGGTDSASAGQDDSGAVQGGLGTPDAAVAGEGGGVDASGAGGRDGGDAGSAGTAGGAAAVGGELVWAKRAGGSAEDFALSVSVVPDGSSLVAGYFRDTATFGPGEPMETALISTGEFGLFVARY